jgi:HSF-type DNA-binding
MSEDSDNELDPICNLPAFLVEDQEQQDASTLYKYRDFGQVQEDDDDVAEIPPPTPSSRGSAENSIRVQKFPVKLYAILAQKEFHDIICWLPHGRSWKVLKATMFESLVMPLFFEYSNYHSFNRLVNAWSFRRISSGPDRGSYYHEVSFFPFQS